MSWHRKQGKAYRKQQRRAGSQESALALQGIPAWKGIGYVLSQGAAREMAILVEEQESAKEKAPRGA